MTLLQAFGVACARLRDLDHDRLRSFAEQRSSAPGLPVRRSLIRSPHIELEAATNPTNGVRNADPTDGG